LTSTLKEVELSLEDDLAQGGLGTLEEVWA